MDCTTQNCFPIHHLYYYVKTETNTLFFILKSQLFEFDQKIFLRQVIIQLIPICVKCTYLYVYLSFDNCLTTSTSPFTTLSISGLSCPCTCSTKISFHNSTSPYLVTPPTLSLSNPTFVQRIKEISFITLFKKL